MIVDTIIFKVILTAACHDIVKVDDVMFAMLLFSNRSHTQTEREI